MIVMALRIDGNHRYNLKSEANRVRKKQSIAIIAADV
jgi:hypothetical protein